jgi:hypothetical protein
MPYTRPKRNPQYKQGIFTPHCPQKYKGTTPIIARSSYELKMMRWLDNNPAVISWGSETIIIPYQNPLTGRVHRYFVDFNFTIKTKEGEIKKYLVEVKPHNQTLPPKPGRNTKALLKRQAEYIKNQCKWKSAQEWCQKKSYEFCIITEKHLFAK